MILHQDASKRHLVYHPSWDIDSMPACCTSFVLLRLEASYCNAKSRRDELKTLQESGWASSLPSSLSQVQNRIHGPAYALPFNMVMSAVLRDMLSEGNNVLWICTDNIRHGPGDDVHRGPFSTYGFADWLPKQGLATVYNGGTNKGGAVQTWSWHLEHEACEVYCDEQEELYHDKRAEVAVYLPSDGTLHTHMRGGGLRW